MIKSNFCVIVFFFAYLFTSFLPLVSQSTVSLGIDVLERTQFKVLHQKKVALLTNTASKNSFGKKTVDVFVEQKLFKLQTILTPEHGLFTEKIAGEKVNDTLYRGINVHSLYGSLRRPTKKILDGCDVIVVDLQDIGIRSYTYISTMFMVLDAATEFAIPVIILDRPNPLGGDYVEGSVLDTELSSFVGIAPIPYIHGMTIGELAQMFSKERWLAYLKSNPKKSIPSVSIVSMKGWKRSMSWEDTKLTWTPTSPNIPTVAAIRGCAVTGIIGEMSIINIGIGSDSPFQIIGSPTLNSQKLRSSVNAFVSPSIQLQAHSFTPKKGMFTDKKCTGAKLKISTNAKNLLRCFCEIILHIRTTDPKNFSQNFSKDKIAMVDKIMGKKNSLLTIQKGGKECATFLQEFRTTSKDYLNLRKKYLLYK
jgi:uncharacterized protein YbbC (DUF1343 family)